EYQERGRRRGVPVAGRGPADRHAPHHARRQARVPENRKDLRQGRLRRLLRARRMSAAALALGHKADPPQKKAEPRARPAHAPPVALAAAGRIQMSALRVSSPSDPAEREAEATARKIVHMSLPSEAPAPGAGSRGIQRRWVPGP